VNKHSEVVKYNTSFFGVNLHVRKCMPYIILSISFGNFMAFLYCLHYCILTALLNSVLRTLWPFKSCKLSLTAIVFTHLSEYMWFFVLSLGARCGYYTTMYWWCALWLILMELMVLSLFWICVCQNCYIDFKWTSTWYVLCVSMYTPCWFSVLNLLKHVLGSRFYLC
jgi:hypothetical protein